MLLVLIIEAGEPSGEPLYGRLELGMKVDKRP